MNCSVDLQYLSNPREKIITQTQSQRGYDLQVETTTLPTLEAAYSGVVAMQ